MLLAACGPDASPAASSGTSPNGPSSPNETSSAPTSPSELSERRADLSGAEWGVAWRRASWTLSDVTWLAAATDASDEVVLDDGTRFDARTGAPLGVLPYRAIARRADGAFLVVGDGTLELRHLASNSTSPATITSTSASTPLDRTIERARFASLATTPTPSAELPSEDAVLLLTIETRHEATSVTSLVLRAGDDLDELATFLLADGSGSRGTADVRLDDRELVVVVPEECHEGECTPTRLERWSLHDPLDRRVIARAFDEAALDASGRFALVRTLAHRSVRVIDTRDGSTRWSVAEYGPRAESCGDDPGEERWPQAMALAPGGEVAALVESGPGPLALRVIARDGESSTARLEQPIHGASSILFTDDDTLLVGSLGLVALRTGMRREHPTLAWEPSLALGHESTALDAWWSERVVRSADGGIHVRARALDPSEVEAGEGWANAVLRRVVGTTDGATLWSDSRGHHTELVVPACSHGGSNADAYHRVDVSSRGVVHVELTVPPGTSPREVASLLARYVDGPLGAPPTERALPRLPRRDCGI